MQDLHTVEFQLEEGAILPTRKTAGAVGYDIAIPRPVRLHRNRMVKVDTGIRVSSPVPMLLLARSSLTKLGVILANSVGLIDPDFRGTIQLPLVYLGFEENFPMINPSPSKIIEGGSALAQLVFIGAYLPEPRLVGSLDETVRGEGGFGSTGR